MDEQPTPMPPAPPPLTYEETPEIPIVHPSPPKKSGSPFKFIGIVILVVGLFVAGVWLSSYVRDWLPLFTGGGTPAEKTTPTPTGKAETTPKVVIPGDPYADWVTYEVISSLTKKSVPGVSFKLPQDVLAPICDGTACLSQGTYLPGGTRFTVAARGTNQALKDYRGSTITDANGKAFTTKAFSLKAMTGVEFEGSFSGRTVTGYTFTRMHGVMVETSSTTSLEVNHFTPTGIVADFEKDDALFDQILNTFTISSSVIPIASSTPKPATSSAY